MIEDSMFTGVVAENAIQIKEIASKSGKQRDRLAFGEISIREDEKSKKKGKEKDKESFPIFAHYSWIKEPE